MTHVPPILKDASYVKKFKDAGLLLFTYGTLSNDVENFLQQVKMGVDGIIVDDVRKVVDTLNKWNVEQS